MAAIAARGAIGDIPGAVEGIIAIVGDVAVLILDGGSAIAVVVGALVDHRSADARVEVLIAVQVGPARGVLKLLALLILVHAIVVGIRQLRIAKGDDGQLVSGAILVDERLNLLEQVLAGTVARVAVGEVVPKGGIAGVVQIEITGDAHQREGAHHGGCGKAAGLLHRVIAAGLRRSRRIAARIIFAVVVGGGPIAICERGQVAEVDGAGRISGADRLEIAADAVGDLFDDNIAHGIAAGAGRDVAAGGAVLQVGDLDQLVVGLVGSIRQQNTQDELAPLFR